MASETGKGGYSTSGQSYRHNNTAETQLYPLELVDGLLLSHRMRMVMLVKLFALQLKSSNRKRGNVTWFGGKFHWTSTGWFLFFYIL